MRVFVATTIIVMSLAGCLSDDFSLDVYTFRYDDSTQDVRFQDPGWMVRVHNPTDRDHDVSMGLIGIHHAFAGPVVQDGGGNWSIDRQSIGDGATEFTRSLTIPAGGSVLFVVEDTWTQHESEVGYSLYASKEGRGVGKQFTDSWTLIAAGNPTERILAGDHVQTVTVGVWPNGTSFYTNAAALIADPNFPGAPGWVTPEDGTDPLPVYVYDADRTEQPYSSLDRCEFTTIEGYNAMLRDQRAGSTVVHLLQPHEAYTGPGREEHPLFGDTLLFMNTVIAHTPGSPLDALPDPQGACFDEMRICRDNAPSMVADVVCPPPPGRF